MELQEEPTGSVGSIPDAGGNGNSGACTVISKRSADGHPNTPDPALDGREGGMADSDAAQSKTHCGMCGKGPPSSPDDFDCPYLK